MPETATQKIARLEAELTREREVSKAIARIADDEIRKARGEAPKLADALSSLIAKSQRTSGVAPLAKSTSAASPVRHGSHVPVSTRKAVDSLFDPKRKQTETAKAAGRSAKLASSGDELTDRIRARRARRESGEES